MDIPQPDGLELGPFHGVRYTADRASDLASVTAPPYDLIGPDEEAGLRAAHPHNIVRLVRPRPQKDFDRYSWAGQTLRSWLSEGVLSTDPDTALYVYEEVSAAGTQRGLLGCVRLARPQTGIVLPHEATTPGPIADRLHLLRATGANLEPILLLYEGSDAASAIVDEVTTNRRPVSVATTDHEVTYRLWTVTDPDEHRQVTADLRHRTALIADGHHRYATYLRFQEEQHAAGRGPGPWDYGLAMLVDSTTHPPRLGAVHRVLPELAPDDALRRAQLAFRTVSYAGDETAAKSALASAARGGAAFLLGGNGRFHLLTHPDPELMEQSMPVERSLRWRQLSTAVLHHLLIPTVWGIPDDEKNVRTVHSDATDACHIAEDSGGTAVLLHPLGVSDVLAVARAGEPVPRKSTSFGPKPRTGLVLRTLNPPV